MSEPPSPNADARSDDAAIIEAASKMCSEEQGDFGVAEPSSKKRKTTSVDSEDAGDDDQKEDGGDDDQKDSCEGRNWRRVMANRRSARESRERRKKRMDVLEKAVEALTKENAEVVSENRSLRQQISSLLPHVDMASYRRQQNHDLSMMVAAGGMASAPSQFAPMGGLGAGMGLPPSLPTGFHFSGMPQLPSDHLNHQSLAMSQPNLGSASYYEQEQLANLQARQKSRDMQGPHFLP